MFKLHMGYVRPPPLIMPRPRLWPRPFYKKIGAAIPLQKAALLYKCLRFAILASICFDKLGHHKQKRTQQFFDLSRTREFYFRIATKI